MTLKGLAAYESYPRAATALFSSKEGGPKVMLRLGILPTSPSAPQIEENFNFTFTEAISNVSDQEKFKTELSTIIATNRSTDVGAVASATAASDARDRRTAATPAANASTPGTPGTPAASTPLPSGAAASASSTPAPTLNELRKTLLTRHPSLDSLHKSLVRTKLLTEQEFWSGREDLLSSIEAEFQQKKGKGAEMVDPKVESGENGQVKVKITTNMIREIFEEYPSVLRCYNDNVPDPLDETSFWTRYFQSKLFNRNRTTNRAAVNTIKDDPIFDLYLGEEDDELEPKNLKEHDIYRLLDLAATEEDQHEVTNQRDYTMRAGGQRASLPLMRRFNEHSSRLLTQSLFVLHSHYSPTSHDTHHPPRTRSGPQTTSHTAFSLAPGNAGERNKSYYDSILLSDLNDGTNEDRIVLELGAGAGGDKRFSVGVEDGEGENGMKLDKGEEERMVRDVKEWFEGWEPRLGEFEMDDDAVNASVKYMTESMRAKTERSSHSSLTHGQSCSLQHHLTGNATHSSPTITLSGGLPDALLRQLTTLQSSSNELLRQFWSSILPQAANDLSSYTPAQKAAKAERMMGYIKKSEGRCEELVEGLQEGEVRVRVVNALKPVREAMAKAVEEFEKRLKP